jgi:hypothetical protein
VEDSNWARHPVDAFILRKLQEKNLKPREIADRETLIRRVSFTLTGLPPTVAEVSEFLADKSHEAYSRMVDRFLDSPR